MYIRITRQSIECEAEVAVIAKCKAVVVVGVSAAYPISIGAGSGADTDVTSRCCDVASQVLWSTRDRRCGRYTQVVVGVAAVLIHSCKIIACCQTIDVNCLSSVTATSRTTYRRSATIRSCSKEVWDC